MVINGGTLTGPYALYEKDLQNETGNKALEIKDGIFEGQVYSKNCTAFIKGGTFSDVSALYCFSLYCTCISNSEY